MATWWQIRNSHSMTRSNATSINVKRTQRIHTTNSYQPNCVCPCVHSMQPVCACMVWRVFDKLSVCLSVWVCARTSPSAWQCVFVCVTVPKWKRSIRLTVKHNLWHAPRIKKKEQSVFCACLLAHWKHTAIAAGFPFHDCCHPDEDWEKPTFVSAAVTPYGVSEGATERSMSQWMGRSTAVLYFWAWHLVPPSSFHAHFYCTLIKSVAACSFFLTSRDSCEACASGQSVSEKVVGMKSEGKERVL